MSNYHFQAINKKNGEVVNVWAYDDYFGRHQYGYKVGDEIRIYEEVLFYHLFERKNMKASDIFEGENSSLRKTFDEACTNEHEERKLLEGFAHVLNCPICKKKATDRACDDTSKDMKAVHSSATDTVD